MSAFAAELTKVVPLPFDEPHAVTIRALTGAEFERAMDPLDQVIQRYQRKGSITVIERGQDVNDGEKMGAAIGDLRADPLNLFNPHKVVACGVTAWTYATTVPKRALSVQELSKLRPEAVDFIAREVLMLTRPALFQTPAEAAEETKND